MLEEGKLRWPLSHEAKLCSFSKKSPWIIFYRCTTNITLAQIFITVSTLTRLFIWKVLRTIERPECYHHLCTIHQTTHANFSYSRHSDVKQKWRLERRLFSKKVNFREKLKTSVITNLENQSVKVQTFRTQYSFKVSCVTNIALGEKCALAHSASECAGNLLMIGKVSFRTLCFSVILDIGWGNRVFQDYTKLAMLASLPTLYPHIIPVFVFIYTNCC